MNKPIDDVKDELVVDFKSNATVPTTPQDCPERILRQIGRYRLPYPERPAEAAILWTRTATMMHLPNTLLQDAWRRHQDHASQQ